MSDLNDWRLEYGTTSFDFGTLATDYPMSVQVDIGDADAEYQDQPHPTADGVVMGKDKFGGFTLTFDLTTLPPDPAVAKMWVPPLDLFSSFKAAWRADSIRRTPGQYATLTNLDRNRMVYGRPRNCAPKLARLRRGIVSYLSTFETNGPDWYDATTKSATITPIPPSGGGGLSFPFTAPILFTAGSATTHAVTNDGDIGAWPRIEFHGPGSGFSVALVSGATTLWTQSITGSLAYDEVFTLDTRPWRRSGTVNGRPANGRLRGSRVEDLAIPVGGYDLVFTVKDSTGTAFAKIDWNDAYASM